MKKIIASTLLVVSVAALVVVSLASSQSAPELINYQGRLTDSGGQPLDGVTVDLSFTFYGSATGDTVYLSVLEEDVLVSAGVYHVLVGAGVVTRDWRVRWRRCFKIAARSGWGSRWTRTPR